jgi:hypothetical protein
MSCLAQLPEKLYSETAFEGFGASRGLHLQTAAALIWMSQLSYETDIEKIDRILGIWGLERRLILKGPASRFLSFECNRGLVATGRGASIVAFVGTDPLSLGHWITNLDLGLSVRGTHNGFQQVVDTTWDDLCTILDESSGTGRSVFMTGHSMGGAVATIAAHQAGCVSGNDIKGIYTFGGLRAGGQKFAAAYRLGDVTYRFIHGHDILAQWPPHWSGYRHVGVPLSCNQGQTFKNLPFASPSSDTEVASKMPERTDLIGRAFGILPRGIRDHIPDSYLRALT